MKVGDKILCIKDFEPYLKKGQKYKVDGIDAAHIVIEYPYTDDQLISLKLYGGNIDNRIQFSKYKQFGNFYFDKYFSDRKTKLEKIYKIDEKCN